MTTTDLASFEATLAAIPPEFGAPAATLEGANRIIDLMAGEIAGLRTEVLYLENKLADTEESLNISRQQHEMWHRIVGVLLPKKEAA